MRYSKMLGKTRKEAPKDEVSINAKLLFRGGFIDKLMAGSYTLLHLGRRVEKKIEQITQMGKEHVIAVIERRGEVIYYKINRMNFYENKAGLEELSQL